MDKDECYRIKERGIDIENEIIKKTRAYKEGKIVYLDGVNWYFSSNGVTTEAEKLDEILNELK